VAHTKIGEILSHYDEPALHSLNHVRCYLSALLLVGGGTQAGKHVHVIALVFAQFLYVHV